MIIALLAEGDSITFTGSSYFYKALGIDPATVGGRSVVPPSDHMPLRAQSFTYEIGGKSIIARNMAISGSHLSQNANDCVARAASNIDAALPSQSAGPVPRRTFRWPRRAVPVRKYVLSLLIGSNDGCIGGYAGEGQTAGCQHFADDVGAYCLARRGVGFSAIILCTVLPRGDGIVGDFEGNRTVFNTRVKSVGWAASHGVTVICDLGAHAIMGDAANIGNTDYYVDAVHPAPDVGQALLATPWLASVTDVVAAL